MCSIQNINKFNFLICNNRQSFSVERVLKLGNIYIENFISILLTLHLTFFLTIVYEISTEEFKIMHTHYNYNTYSKYITRQFKNRE